MDEGEKIADEQAGFRSGYSTTDHVFQKTHAVMKEESVCSFTDYQKALNTVERKNNLWACFPTKENVEYY